MQTITTNTVPVRDSTQDFTINIPGITSPTNAFEPRAATFIRDYIYIGNSHTTAGFAGDNDIYAFSLSDKTVNRSLDRELNMHSFSVVPRSLAGYEGSGQSGDGVDYLFVSIDRGTSISGERSQVWGYYSGLRDGHFASAGRLLAGSAGSAGYGTIIFSIGNKLWVNSGFQLSPSRFVFQGYTIIPNRSSRNILTRDSSIDFNVLTPNPGLASDYNLQFSATQDRTVWLGTSGGTTTNHKAIAYTLNASGVPTRDSSRDFTISGRDSRAAVAVPEGIYMFSNTLATKFFRTKTITGGTQRIKPTLFAYTLADTARHKHYPSSIWRTKPEYKVPRIASTSIARDTSEDFATGLSGASLRIKASAIKGNTLFLGTFLTSDRRASSGVAYNLQTKTRDNALDFSIPA